MRRNLMLARNNAMGSIQRCRHEVVHIHLNNEVSLHLTEEAFLNFASMVKEAASVLIDEGLADLIRDRNIEK